MYPLRLGSDTAVMFDPEVDVNTQITVRDRVWRSLPPVTLALTLLYLLFTISHALLLPTPVRAQMVTMAGATTFVFLALGVSVRRVPALRPLTFPIAFLIIVLLSTNSTLHLWLTGEMVQTTNVMLVILGAGLLVLSGVWYILTVTVVVASWVAAVAGLLEQALFVHFAFALLSACMASIVARFVVVRDLVENHRLRVISEQQREKLEHQATHDVLTGLANRRKLQEHLDLEAARVKRSGDKLAILYIDLDSFKPMNDTHGHDYGDEVLVFIGKTLRTLTRETDLVCRLGGDEFAVLLTGLKNIGDAALVESKIAQRFKTPGLIQGISTTISMSIGWAVLPDDTRAPQELLRLADQRMYRNKPSAPPGDNGPIDTRLPGRSTMGSDAAIEVQPATSAARKLQTTIDAPDDSGIQAAFDVP
jgi:diguanylate cyclase (GGDEF)-like protein